MLENRYRRMYEDSERSNQSILFRLRVESLLAKALVSSLLQRTARPPADIQDRIERALSAIAEIASLVDSLVSSDTSSGVFKDYDELRTHARNIAEFTGSLGGPAIESRFALTSVLSDSLSAAAVKHGSRGVNPREVTILGNRDALARIFWLLTSALSLSPGAELNILLENNEVMLEIPLVSKDEDMSKTFRTLEHLSKDDLTPTIGLSDASLTLFIARQYARQLSGDILLDDGKLVAAVEVTSIEFPTFAPVNGSTNAPALINAVPVVHGPNTVPTVPTLSPVSEVTDVLRTSSPTSSIHSATSLASAPDSLKPPRSLSTCSSPSKSLNGRILNILLVEDDNTTALYFKRWWAKKNQNVTIAVTGQEAVDLVMNGTRFSIVFMDINVPIKNGFQTAKEIRDYEKIVRMSPVPIIGVSGDALANKTEEASKAGMDGFIEKPYVMSRVHDLVLHHCGSPV